MLSKLTKCIPFTRTLPRAACVVPYGKSVAKTTLDRMFWSISTTNQNVHHISKNYTPFISHGNKIDLIDVSSHPVVKIDSILFDRFYRDISTDLNNQICINRTWFSYNFSTKLLKLVDVVEIANDTKTYPDAFQYLTHLHTDTYVLPNFDVGAETFVRRLQTEQCDRFHPFEK